MNLECNEFTLYGLSKYNEVIDKIIASISKTTSYEICFDIRLMLTEALTNAFKHGNNNDEKKPIYLRYSLRNLRIKFEVEDCGQGPKDVNFHRPIENENILEETGRGLFIIKSLADKIEVKNNILIIEKNLASS